MNQVNMPSLVEGMCSLEVRVLIAPVMADIITTWPHGDALLLFSNLHVACLWYMVFPAPFVHFLGSSPQLQVCLEDTSQQAITNP